MNKVLFTTGLLTLSLGSFCLLYHLLLLIICKIFSSTRELFAHTEIGCEEDCRRKREIS